MRRRASARRLRTRAAFGVRPLAGAVGKQYCPRSATGYPLFRFPRLPDKLLKQPRSPGWPASTPAWGGCTRTGGLGLKTAKLCLQSSFRPLQPPRGPTVGRKTQTRPRVGGFSSKGHNSLFEQPSPFPRFVPVGAVGTLRNRAFSWDMPCRALQKCNGHRRLADGRAEPPWRRCSGHRAADFFNLSSLVRRSAEGNQAIRPREKPAVLLCSRHPQEVARAKRAGGWQGGLDPLEPAENPTFLGHRLGRLRPLPSGTEPLTPEATNRPRSPPGDRSHATDPLDNLAAAGPASQSLRMRRPGPDRETPRNAKTRFERDRRGERNARQGQGGCAPRGGSVRGVSSGGRRAAAAQPGAGPPPAAELWVPDTTGAITTSTPRACSAATSSCGAPLSVTTTSIGSRSHR